MSMLGGEGVSRLAVGVFTLLLTGGLAAFFTGLLDPFIGTQNPPPSKPAIPSAKPFQPAPAQPTPAKPSVANTAKVATPANTATPAPAQVTAVIPATPQMPVKVATATAPAMLDQATMTDKPDGMPPKPHAFQQARSHDLDLRDCLTLDTDMAIAQCAYKKSP